MLPALDRLARFSFPACPMSQDAPPKQHSAAALKIRELILQGQLPPGMRVTEAALAEMLGLSRTPVRQALPSLAKDGLLTPVGKRGYAVRGFTSEESRAALEVRSALEGLAAKTVAERGLAPGVLAQLRDCLARGDAILAARRVLPDTQCAYGEMNDSFHRLILEAAGHPLLVELVARCEMVPFVSPAAMVFSEAQGDLIFDDLLYAHRQHHYIVEALQRGEAARVEMLMREHAATQRHSMNL